MIQLEESTSAVDFHSFTATATLCTAGSNMQTLTEMLSLVIPTLSIILEASPLTLGLVTISDASATKPLNTIEGNCGGYVGNTAGLME